jgi:CBS domain-containing protein
MSASRSLRVRDLMQPEVATIGRNDEAALADQIMAVGRIRHLPVVDEDGRLVGILSRRDLFRGALASALGYGQHAQDKVLHLLRVKDVMTPEPRTIGPDAPLAEAADLLLKHKISCLPVVEGDTLVGILTEASFVELAASSAARRRTDVTLYSGQWDSGSRCGPVRRFACVSGWWKERKSVPRATRRVRRARTSVAPQRLSIPTRAPSAMRSRSASSGWTSSRSSGERSWLAVRRVMLPTL